MDHAATSPADDRNYKKAAWSLEGIRSGKLLEGRTDEGRCKKEGRTVMDDEGRKEKGRTMKEGVMMQEGGGDDAGREEGRW